jgi:hypothetical protein
MEQFLLSPVRTEDPSEANLFYIPSFTYAYSGQMRCTILEAECCNLPGWAPGAAQTAVSGSRRLRFRRRSPILPFVR